MGQFKPMVKMMTTEPSVELKLKKGGSVKKAMGGPMGRPMPSSMPGGLPAAGGDVAAAAPQRPSLAARRRAMMARPGGAAPAAPVGTASRMMKEGGESKSEHKAEMKAIKGVKSELKKHEGKPASKGHKGLKTGGVVMGQSGFKAGGAISKSGIIPESASARGAEGYKNTKMHDAERKVKISGKTGKVTANGIAGMKTGGAVKWVEGNVVDGDKAGPTNTKTGGVKLGNAGGYKKGGEAKKAYAAGGEVKSGAPVAMPRKKPSQPVSNDRQSGTFKKGGSVKKAEGGDVQDLSKGAYDKSIGPSDAEMDIARTIRGIPRKLYRGAKDLLGGQGSVTDSERVKASNKFSDLDAQGAITDAERRAVTGKKKGGPACGCK